MSFGPADLDTRAFSVSFADVIFGTHVILRNPQIEHRSSDVPSRGIELSILSQVICVENH